MVPSGAVKGLVKIVKRPESRSSSVAQSSKDLGPHSGGFDDARMGEANEPPSPKPAKVFPVWQSYWIEFKLRKVYHPISTRRIGCPREQPEEIRQTRRKLWERMVPNSSSLMLDLLEGVEINPGRWTRSGIFLRENGTGQRTISRIGGNGFAGV